MHQVVPEAHHARAPGSPPAIWTKLTILLGDGWARNWRSGIPWIHSDVLHLFLGMHVPDVLLVVFFRVFQRHVDGRGG
jgi:hypothetical protein